jgi:adenylosuccinate synthase
MNIAIVGAQWGDEGKGKVVDRYSARADYIVRFQGGNNAGHTLVVQGKKTVLHLIPSGVLHPGKTCLIANGVVFDPNVFFQEIDSLIEAKVFSTQEAPQRVQVSERAHVILPYHRLLDTRREEAAAEGKGKIGTTMRGIGPAYEDKVARRGIQVIDLLHPSLLKEKLERALDEKNTLLEHHFGEKPVEIDSVYQECLKLGERLKPFIQDVRSVLVKAMKEKKPILFEGAQGTLLDIDHGTYPYVTSSNTIAGGVLSGCGVGPRSFDQVIGITKAYTTRVGAGPFPTEMLENEEVIAKKIRDIGQEYGATTGRPRRVGWLDLVALKYAVEVNGLTGLALTKVDILDGFEELKVCTEYKGSKGLLFQTVPACIEDFENLKPVYQTIKGWAASKITEEVKTKDELAPELKNYLKVIEDFVGVPVVLLSTGPGRQEALEIYDPFNSGIAL